MSMKHADFNPHFFHLSTKNKCSFSRLVYNDVIYYRKYTYDDNEMATIYDKFYNSWLNVVITNNHPRYR